MMIATPPLTQLSLVIGILMPASNLPLNISYLLAMLPVYQVDT